jgi:hypothetical protein
MPYQHKKRKIRRHRQPDRKAMALRKRLRKRDERQEIAKRRLWHRVALNYLSGKPTLTQKFGGGLNRRFQ